LSFNSEHELFAGIHIGVRGSQVGLTTLSGETLAEENVEILSTPQDTLSLLRASLKRLVAKFPERQLKVIGVSVPGIIDAERAKLVYAPHLAWKNVAIAENLRLDFFNDVGIVVENDATAAAMYEARLRLKKTNDALLNDFILVRSGTGIGVGLVINGEAYRGVGKSEGIAGEFGHMTIVAGGKPCACGNRGCWEQYAAAAAASPLYTGDRLQLGQAKPPRYVEIVDKARTGEIRAQRTLERIGEYLGIGIANVITGLGVPQVILSGRIVYGWEFIRESLRKAVGQSMAGKLSDWSVEAGEQSGAGLGGAFEVAVEEFLTYGFNQLI
jgi:predicted NBD/HSP70 family sugar kinase